VCIGGLFKLQKLLVLIDNMKKTVSFYIGKDLEDKLNEMSINRSKYVDKLIRESFSRRKR